jgi:hypothetical protein
MVHNVIGHVLVKEFKISLLGKAPPFLRADVKQRKTLSPFCSQEAFRQAKRTRTILKRHNEDIV